MLLGLVFPVSKTIYKKTHVKVQKVVKIATIACPVMTPFILIVPPFIGNFSTYFTTDLGADALELPLPMWYKANKFFWYFSNIYR